MRVMRGHSFHPLPSTKIGETSERCRYCDAVRTTYRGRVFWTRDAVCRGIRREPLLVIDPPPSGAPKCDPYA